MPVCYRVRMDRLRVRHSLHALALGDAWGAPVENMPDPSVDFPDGLPGLFAGRSGRCRSRWAGRTTDDTAMSLALARTCLDGPYDPARALDAYVRWARYDGHGMGSTTRAVLAAAAEATDPLAAAAEAAALAARRRSLPSNGSLMRAAGLLVGADVDEDAYLRLAVADCRLTHDHPVAVDAVRCMQALLYAGVHHRPATMPVARTDEVAERLSWDLDRSLAAAPEGHTDVPVPVGLAAAALREGVGLCEAIQRVVEAGGDTDTNAAVVGAVLGAHGHVPPVGLLAGLRPPRCDAQTLSRIDAWAATMTT